MAGLIAVGFVAATVFAFVLVVRRLGKSKSMVLVTRTDAVRARAMADAAMRTSDRTFGVAERALDVAGTIGVVDAKIDVVDAKMDELLGHAAGEAVSRGRHSRALRSVPGGRDIA